MLWRVAARGRFECAKAGVAQAKQATFVAGVSGFIEACWFGEQAALRLRRVARGEMVRRDFRGLAAEFDCAAHLQTGVTRGDANDVFMIGAISRNGTAKKLSVTIR